MGELNLSELYNTAKTKLGGYRLNFGVYYTPKF